MTFEEGITGKRDSLRIIELKESILEDNDADAAQFQSEMNADGVYLVNVMSAPGSGKTTLLAALLPYLQKQVRVGVLESDIDGDVDARTMAAAGAITVQVHTGGMCHLDADMTRQSLHGLPEKAELVFLENIGNLVCPAEYATGAHLNIMLLSIPEGDDKPFKYPLMFGMVDAVIITKTDVADYFDFSVERVRKELAEKNPKAGLFCVSAKEDRGVSEVAQWLLQGYDDWKEALHGTGD